jgi:hypothetical protein
MAAVQYTFTHKQYTEQHYETEYTERNTYKYTQKAVKDILRYVIHFFHY